MEVGDLEPHTDLLIEIRESRFSSRGVGAAGATSTAGGLRTVNLGGAEEHAIPAVANGRLG